MRKRWRQWRTKRKIRYDLAHRAEEIQRRIDKVMAKPAPTDPTPRYQRAGATLAAIGRRSETNRVLFQRQSAYWYRLARGEMTEKEPFR